MTFQGFVAILAAKKSHTGRPDCQAAGADKGEPVELTSFEELDKKIRIVISDYALLKKQYGELEEQLKKKSLDLEEAQNHIRGLTEERDFIRTKVDSLLELLRDVPARQ